MAAQTGLLQPQPITAQITLGLSLWLDEKRGSRQGASGVNLDRSHTCYYLRGLDDHGDKSECDADVRVRKILGTYLS